MRCPLMNHHGCPGAGVQASGRNRGRETYRRTEGVGVSEEMIFMLVLWSTLGRCWMVSWVRGETGECWWL